MTVPNRQSVSSRSVIAARGNDQDGSSARGNRSARRVNQLTEWSKSFSRAGSREGPLKRFPLPNTISRLGSPLGLFDSTATKDAHWARPARVINAAIEVRAQGPTNGLRRAQLQFRPKGPPFLLRRSPSVVQRRRVETGISVVPTVPSGDTRSAAGFLVPRVRASRHELRHKRRLAGARSEEAHRSQCPGFQVEFLVHTSCSSTRRRRLIRLEIGRSPTSTAQAGDVSALPRTGRRP